MKEEYIKEFGIDIKEVEKEIKQIEKEVWDKQNEVILLMKHPSGGYSYSE